MSIVESSASACWIGPCFVVSRRPWEEAAWDRWRCKNLGNIWESHVSSHGKTGKKLTHPHIRWKTWLQISSNHYPVTLVAWVLTFSEYYLREFALAALSHRFKDSCMGVKIYPRRAISRLNSGFRGTYLFQTTYGVKVRSFRSMWKIAGRGCHGYGLAWFS